MERTQKGDCLAEKITCGQKNDLKERGQPERRNDSAFIPNRAIYRGRLHDGVIDILPAQAKSIFQGRSARCAGCAPALRAARKGSGSFLTQGLDAPSR
jgi:hypothetical protein